MGSSKDICSLFDSYLPNHEASTHEITWIMFSTQLRISSKKNRIKRSLYVMVMSFTNLEIFSTREFIPPEKLEMANLLSDEPTTNSIMKKENLGLDGFQKDSKTDLFGQLAKGKMDFNQSSKGHVLAHIRNIFFTFQSPGRGYIKRQSKFQSKTLFSQVFVFGYLRVNKPLFRWTCASYQATYRNPSFVGLVRHIKKQLKSGSIKRLSALFVSPFSPPVLSSGESLDERRAALRQRHPESTGRDSHDPSVSATYFDNVNP
ncbi:hypothetical protein IGI04_030987 [Brassica rapa subsp. trilocularis]|uniref:Uncharacterized protein n=1 Tax=Brassica rapa subsp. trilocularis TaxID=1813537 RepID=A0ABQ7LSB7_BRACM|nr:hypothetical protein IGI04_030987 [Brassica rapa subsp. trilocularis]